uniref:Uncharacterized protein n=1 Tax=Anopheles culicifacies TaxID=139723 RepID=A0A182LWC2_9DIPT
MQHLLVLCTIVPIVVIAFWMLDSNLRQHIITSLGARRDKPSELCKCLPIADHHRTTHLDRNPATCCTGDGVLGSAYKIAEHPEAIPVGFDIRANYVVLVPVTKAAAGANVNVDSPIDNTKTPKPSAKRNALNTSPSKLIDSWLRLPSLRMSIVMLPMRPETFSALESAN